MTSTSPYTLIKPDTAGMIQRTRTIVHWRTKERFTVTEWVPADTAPDMPIPPRQLTIATSSEGSTR